MLTGHVISDLHIFASWSWAERYIDRMRAAADKADFFVLNGDIFEFRWSTLGRAEVTAHAAVDWLERFAGDHPRCTLHYVLGNHDGLVLLAERLELLAERLDNFRWYPAYVRMGHALFAHGDLFYRSRANPFERPLPATIRRHGPPLSWAYHGIHAVRGTRLAHLGSRPGRCARRIVRSLAAAPRELIEGVTDIYCGHTHVAVSDFAWDGLTFHNTGSGIRHLECNMCTLSVGVGPGDET